jgi:aminopeptidase
MTDFRLINLAQTLVNYCVSVREKDLVGIVAQPPATPLIREVLREVLRSGGYPYLLPYGLPLPTLGYEGLEEVFFKEGSDDQLKHQDLFWRELNRDFDVRIVILSEFNPTGLSGIDPERLKIRKRAYREIEDIYFERMASGDLRRVSTLFPTVAYAAGAGMSLEEFEDYVYRVTFSDSPDPVAEWKRLRSEQQHLVDWLKGKKHLRVTGPNADLTLSIEGRVFINSDGKQNMPSGEIFTGPVEDSAEGWIRFSYPSILSGREVEGIRLEFEKGKVVNATAEKDQEFLQAMLEIDSGSRYLGEFAFGTNRRIDRFIHKILFDEKIGGTIHLALGQGYPITGSRNQSAIHWDMICEMRDGGRVEVDGEPFYDSGEFLV